MAKAAVVGAAVTPVGVVGDASETSNKGHPMNPETPTHRGGRQQAGDIQPLLGNASKVMVDDTTRADLEAAYDEAIAQVG